MSADSRVNGVQAPTLAQRAILAFDRMETSLRGRGLAWFRRRSGFVRYKMLKRLLLLEQVASALDREGIPHCVTGGVSYDALRGALTRYHVDVDFALLREYADRAFAALRAQGLVVTPLAAHKAVAARGELHADLFLWEDVGHGKIEMMSPVERKCTVVQMPREFLSTIREAELLGVRFRIPCNEYFLSILPFVVREEDREFISKLDTTLSLQFEESVGRMEISTRRFEFRSASRSRPS